MIVRIALILLVLCTPYSAYAELRLNVVDLNLGKGKQEVSGGIATSLTQDFDRDYTSTNQFISYRRGVLQSTDIRILFRNEPDITNVELGVSQKIFNRGSVSFSTSGDIENLSRLAYNLKYLHYKFVDPLTLSLSFSFSSAPDGNEERLDVKGASLGIRFTANPDMSIYLSTAYQEVSGFSNNEDDVISDLRNVTTTYGVTYEMTPSFIGDVSINNDSGRRLNGLSINVTKRF